MKELLLYNLNPLYLNIFNKLKADSLNLIPAIILISSFFNFFFAMDFCAIIKRTIIALICIFIYEGLYSSSSNLGFHIADSIITKNNHVLKDFSSAKAVRREGFKLNISKIGFFEGIGDDIIGVLTWLLSNIALWFVKISFTIAYYLPLISIPIVALINIFPFSAKAIDGALYSLVWITITPIVIAIILEILNAIVISDSLINETSFISRTLISILFALYLISSFAISSKMMGATGISDGIISTAQSYGTGVVTGITSFALSRSRRLGSNFIIGRPGEDSPLKKMTLNPINEGRGFMHETATSIMDSKELSAKDIFEGVIPNYSKKEKAFLGANKVLNPIKSLRDHYDRKKTANEYMGLNKGNQRVTRNDMNISRLNRGKAELDKSGRSVQTKSKKRKKQDKETYIFDPTFWNKASKSYQDGIRNKYGIPPHQLPVKGFLYQPVDGRNGFPKGYWDKYYAMHPDSNINPSNLEDSKIKNLRRALEKRPTPPIIATEKTVVSTNSTKPAFRIIGMKLHNPDKEIKFYLGDKI